jgi:hypothetical protein
MISRTPTGLKIWTPKDAHNCGRRRSWNRVRERRVMARALLADYGAFCDEALQREFDGR